MDLYTIHHSFTMKWNRQIKSVFMDEKSPLSTCRGHAIRLGWIPVFMCKNNFCLLNIQFWLWWMNSYFGWWELQKVLKVHQEMQSNHRPKIKPTINQGFRGESDITTSLPQHVTLKFTETNLNCGKWKKHCSDIKWASCHLKQLANWLFVQKIVEADKTSKLRINGPL